MNPTRRAFVIAAALAPWSAQAQGWPPATIRFVVPFAAGGSVDGIPRLVQPRLQERLGVSVIIENKPGASGTTGTALVAKAPPDGGTWLSIADTLAVSPALFPALPYNTEKDLEPVLLVGTSPYVLAANVQRPFKTFADVIAAARAKPDSISYASFGTGSGGHLAMVRLGKKADARLVHVPYRGGGPAVADAIAGHVDLVIGSAALITPLIQSGKLRGIVQMGPDRLASMPDIPTTAESGFPDVEGVVWWGIFTTAGTPASVVERIRRELAAALDEERVRKQVTEVMQIKMTLQGPDVLRRFLADQIRIWGEVVRESQIKAEE